MEDKGEPIEFIYKNFKLSEEDKHKVINKKIINSDTKEDSIIFTFEDNDTFEIRGTHLQIYAGDKFISIEEAFDYICTGLSIVDIFGNKDDEYYNIVLEMVSNSVTPLFFRSPELTVLYNDVMMEKKDDTNYPAIAKNQFEAIASYEHTGILKSQVYVITNLKLYLKDGTLILIEGELNEVSTVRIINKMLDRPIDSISKGTNGRIEFCYIGDDFYKIEVFASIYNVSGIYHQIGG